MEESDQLRHTSVLDELTADGINEDVYSTLREDLESDARDFEAPTWSLAVDQEYVKYFSKEAAKRQDVIYELIQTEINHVRTLKLMHGVYLRELGDSLLMDESQLQRLFPRLDCLLQEHHNFLQTLKKRRRECLETGSDKNYFISNIADILIAQFSDDLRSRLQDSYGVFCGRHTEAGTFYKEQLQNNKKFQSVIRRIGQLPIMRRLGVPEGILLITQRITKYPVLVERIIKNTEEGTEEHTNLGGALECIKDTISTVDTRVHQYEQLRGHRRSPGTQVQRQDEQRQGDPQRRSAPEGQEAAARGSTDLETPEQVQRFLCSQSVMFPGLHVSVSQGPHCPLVVTLNTDPDCALCLLALDVIVVLLPDLLLLLQDKDQKYIFASLDGKPAVLPLQKLIVREAAHSDRVLYLISASDVQADLYELQTSTAEERSSWRQKIWETIEKCPHVEEEPMEYEDIYPNKLREVHDQLCEKDAQVEEILRQKMQIISDLSEVQTDNLTSARRLLLRGSAPELQQGELLINNAIIQAESLQMQMIEGEMNFIAPPGESDDVKLQIKPQTLPAFNRMSKSGDGFRSRDQRPNSDPHLRDLYLDPLELSVCNTPVSHRVKAEWIESADKLIRMLYSLKALVSQQDTQLEVLRAAQLERDRPSRQRFSSIQDQERQRHLEKQREELLHLQKVHTKQQQQHEAWAREHQKNLLKMHELEQELNRRMDECTKQEVWLSAERDVLNQSREKYQQDLERLRESGIAVDREREKLEQEIRCFRKYKNLNNQGGTSYPDNTNTPNVTKLPVPYSSPDDLLSTRSLVQPGLPQERPPLVPPRKESISVTASAKADVPLQLLSTTNEALKSSSIQQQIPTKLAISKGKEKNKSKSSHHRTNSAASIDVSEVFPIKVSGKEGGSLRAMKPTNLHTHTAVLFVLVLFVLVLFVLVFIVLVLFVLVLFVLVLFVLVLLVLVLFVLVLFVLVLFVLVLFVLVFIVLVLFVLVFIVLVLFVLVLFVLVFIVLVLFVLVLFVLVFIVLVLFVLVLFVLVLFVLVLFVLVLFVLVLFVLVLFVLVFIVLVFIVLVLFVLVFIVLVFIVLVFFVLVFFVLVFFVLVFFVLVFFVLVFIVLVLFVLVFIVLVLFVLVFIVLVLFVLVLFVLVLFVLVFFVLVFIVLVLFVLVLFVLVLFVLVFFVLVFFVLVFIVLVFFVLVFFVLVFFVLVFFVLVLFVLVFFVLVFIVLVLFVLVFIVLVLFVLVLFVLVFIVLVLFVLVFFILVFIVLVLFVLVFIVLVLFVLVFIVLVFIVLVLFVLVFIVLVLFVLVFIVLVLFVLVLFVLVFIVLVLFVLVLFVLVLF
ncbi:hypothetical protein QTP70_033423 [Hemibagrus guttatus]|uniref:Rho guanine nucleotide exchange factor 18 n=1 Tax=Hemibagrus guttatus TaxID=175788 RepID=A0AAE0R9S4_9TELE|nr:hypothetical protein QTP70_033423 [Hemibagrus guttatus]